MAGAVGTDGAGLAKASFVKVKCRGKTAKGKRVTCKVKGELPQGPQGEQGPAGADGVSGYETIRHFQQHQPRHVDRPRDHRDLRTRLSVRPPWRSRRGGRGY